ncbi:MAG TPA: hypothetical protein VLB04_03500, partial [Methanotrichaceae archaeon]|nr:hypothetical protein [Methanotrichaceae archaeon]
MIKKGFALVLLVTVSTLASIGSGQDDDIGEGLFIDGPGGYLPNVEDDVDSNVNFDSNMNFAQAPSMNNEGFTNYWVLYGELL